MVLAICEMGAASANAKIARPMPISIVVGMLIRVSTSQRTYRRLMSQCRAHGMKITFRTTVRTADTYRWFCPVVQATIAVDSASAAPCHAYIRMSVRMRRCDSIANASSSRKAASRLTTWPESVCVMRRSPGSG
jgi:hypothetical protein